MGIKGLSGLVSYDCFQTTLCSLTWIYRAFDVSGSELARRSRSGCEETKQAFKWAGDLPSSDFMFAKLFSCSCLRDLNEDN